MEIRNLKTFLKVSSLKNFTAAAKELGYSQANVSAQIKQLEQELGAPLFNRIGRRVTVTQYAEELIPYAMDIVSKAMEMESLMKTGESLGGTVRIGMVESLFHTVGEAAILAFHKACPNVFLDIVVDGTAVLKERLQQDTLDMACLIDDPLPLQQWQIPCTREAAIVAVARPSHPAAARDSMSLTDLACLELITMEPSAPYTVRFMATMAQARIDVKPFLVMQSADTASHMAQTEDFAAILPYYTVAGSVSDGRLKILDVDGFSLCQDVQVILHRDKVFVPQLKAFADIFADKLSGLWMKP